MNGTIVCSTIFVTDDKQILNVIEILQLISLNEINTD